MADSCLEIKKSYVFHSPILTNPGKEHTDNIKTTWEVLSWFRKACQGVSGETWSSYWILDKGNNWLQLFFIFLFFHQGIKNCRAKNSRAVSNHKMDNLQYPTTHEYRTWEQRPTKWCWCTRSELYSIMIKKDRSKGLNIGYRDRIGRGFFIPDIGYRERYRGYARISDAHIRHYI